jgi:serine protease Do
VAGGNPGESLSERIARIAREISPTVVRIEIHGGRRIPSRGKGKPKRRNIPDLHRRLRKIYSAPLPIPYTVHFGAGVIIDPEGLILTNNTLVAYDRAIIEVALNDGRVFNGKVLGRDEFLDIALIEIEARGLPVIELGESLDVQPGHFAVAFGNPFGLARDNKPAVNLGTVSAVRKLPVEEIPYAGTVIQTDAAINPGSSGGPLVDIRGRLIGLIAPLVRSTRTGEIVGYAVPVDEIKKRLRLLRAGKILLKAPREIDEEGGSIYRKGYLGVLLDESDRTDRGALVEGVVAGSPAQRAGIKSGDVIIEFNGERIGSSRDLIRQLRHCMPGRLVKIKIHRKGWEKELGIRLGRRDF